jgi:hypothetical protein
VCLLLQDLLQSGVYAWVYVVVLITAVPNTKLCVFITAVPITKLFAGGGGGGGGWDP